MLDATDMKIIHMLLKNAKISLSEIGAELKISQPAVRKRLEKLKRKGVVLGSTIVLNERRIGWERAILALDIDKLGYLKTIEKIKATPLVTAIYTTTGPYTLSVEVLGPVGIVKEVIRSIGAIKGVNELCPLTFVEKIK